MTAAMRSNAEAAYLALVRMDVVGDWLIKCHFSLFFPMLSSPAQQGGKI
jgi:hypothetical protein